MVAPEAGGRTLGVWAGRKFIHAEGGSRQLAAAARYARDGVRERVAREGAGAGAREREARY